jgi:hypothetical protein
MFLYASSTGELKRWIVLHQAVERHVLARMMEAIWIVPHVIDNRAQQLVVWAPALMKDVDLLLNQIQQSTEIAMVGVPSVKRSTIESAATRSLLFRLTIDNAASYFSKVPRNQAPRLLNQAQRSPPATDLTRQCV